MTILKKCCSGLLVIVLLLEFTACGVGETAKQIAGSTKDKAVSIKDTVADWYKEIDFNRFRTGWDAAVDWMGSAYSAASNSAFLQTDYIQGVSNAINDLKVSMNSAYGSARGTAQEAGFAAEKWVSGTFNIDAAAKESGFSAETVGSHTLGSVDISTNYGEEASLKYYQSGSASAKAQAETLIEAYRNYARGKTNPMSLQEYMDSHGYDYETQSKLLPLYDGQTRIIPANQLSEAKALLEGRITTLSSNPGPEAEQLTATYQQTLDSLKDRLTAPDGTSSKPVTYEEMQAIAELSQDGSFRPEDFGLTVSQVIPPKYVLKEVVGTGLEVGLMRAIFTIGPDVFSIVSHVVETGEFDIDELKDIGVEGVIALSEGFVEGAVSRIVIEACQEGLLGEALKSASPNIVGAIVFLTIEAVIFGYSLATGEISPEDYGNLMADRIMITAIAIPVTTAILAVLPGTKLFMLAGCLAGGMIACGGYSFAKEAILEFVDGGGFEAIIPVGLADGIEGVRTAVGELNIHDQLSNLQAFTVSTATSGLITIKKVFS